MADFPLLLVAPDQAWVAHVQELIQQALHDKGSVHLGSAGERLPDSPSSPGHVVTGIAVCDEPADEMLALITAKLVGYDVELRDAPGGTTQVVVRPLID